MILQTRTEDRSGTRTSRSEATAVTPVWCALALLLGFAMAAPAQVTRPIPVPGRIEAEHYDTKGTGVSYYDTTAGNSGSVYRNEDVDIEATADSGGGYNVGWIASSEWLTYTLNVQSTAIYQLGFRVASANGTGDIQVMLDGLPLATVITPLTGGWQTWQTVTVSNLVLRAGQRILRLEFRVGGQNLNYVQVAKQADLTGGFLRVSGKQIVDAQGNNMLLRGMGLGNWMLQEPYMMEVSGIAATQSQLREKIAGLVGNANRDLFYRAWLTNSLREPDIAAMARAGFNSIRLPMHFNLFTPPVEQEPIPGQITWLAEGFELVDDLLAWCESHQLYLILDMHACPGGQGKDQPISDYNPPAPSLWESPHNRAKLVALWGKLAARYANRTWIGGYDLINEPNWTFEGRTNINGCEDQTNAPLRQLLMEITSTIRQVDTNHIIFLEGNCWAGNYNGVLPPWDQNLVISFHKYWDSPAPASFQKWVDHRDKWNLPVWLGESGENSNEWFREAIGSAELLNVGWAWWPWKKIGPITGPALITKPAGYQAILNYWKNAGPRPGTNEALAGLLSLSEAARFENCSVRRDVLDSMLRPNTAGMTVAFTNHSVPGTIYAVHYDLGRYGEAYFDTTTNNPHNSGNSFRNDTVDIERCADTSTVGYNVGWTSAGEWLKYSVAIPTGPIGVSTRVAGGSAGGRFHLEIAGKDVTGPIEVPETGGYQSWTTLPTRVFTNATGASSFKLVVDSPGFNLHWIRFTNLAPNTPAGLKAQATSSSVHLTWQDSPGAASYYIQRATTPTGPFAIIASQWPQIIYNDGAVANGATSYYRVSAANAFGLSSPSEIAAVTVPFPRLEAHGTQSALTVSWLDSASPLALQTATSVAPPVLWIPVTNTPSFDGDRWTVTWAARDSVRLFRLVP